MGNIPCPHCLLNKTQYYGCDILWSMSPDFKKREKRKKKQEGFVENTTFDSLKSEAELKDCGEGRATLSRQRAGSCPAEERPQLLVHRPVPGTSLKNKQRMLSLNFKVKF